MSTVLVAVVFVLFQHRRVPMHPPRVQGESHGTNKQPEKSVINGALGDSSGNAEGSTADQ
jgi:hypothetical protein